MTLEEAITNLECLEQSSSAGLDDDEREAIKLGIEALKWVKRYQDGLMPRTINPLPGQTFTP